MPLQSKINNNSLFFSVNQRTNTVINEINELRDSLNIETTYLSELKAAIDIDIQAINKSNQKCHAIDEVILVILKLKFIFAALQKIELVDPVFDQAFINDKNAYEKIITVSRDKEGKHKKTADFVCNRLKHLKSQTIIIDGVKVEPDTIEVCDAILAKLNYYKVLGKEEISKHEEHMVEMQENIRKTEIEIFNIKSSIKTLEIDYNFQTFFQNYNTAKHELETDKLSVRNTFS